MQSRTTDTSADAKQSAEKKPPVSSAEFYKILSGDRFRMRAISENTVVNMMRSEAHDLTTRQTSFFKHNNFPFGLPGGRFLVVDDNNCRVKIYSSLTNKLIKEIYLPVSWEPGKTPQAQNEQMSLTPDNKILVVPVNIYDKQYNFERQNFFVDLETYEVPQRYAGQKYLTKVISRDQAIYSGENGMELVQKDKVIPCQIEGKFHAIYTWPEHPSFWVVAAGEENYRNHTYQLFIYDVKFADGKCIATKGKEIGHIFTPDTFLGRVLTLGNSLVYTNANKGVVEEFDLTQQVTRPIEFAGYTDVQQQCVFPDGKIGLVARDSEKKWCFIAAKLTSVCEYADKLEEDMMKAMDPVWVTEKRTQGMPKPLQRIIAGYASGFFARDMARSQPAVDLDVSQVALPRVPSTPA